MQLLRIIPLFAYCPFHTAINKGRSLTIFNGSLFTFVARVILVGWNCFGVVCPQIQVLENGSLIDTLGLELTNHNSILKRLNTHNKKILLYTFLHRDTLSKSVYLYESIQNQLTTMKKTTKNIPLFIIILKSELYCLAAPLCCYSVMSNCQILVHYWADTSEMCSDVMWSLLSLLIWGTLAVSKRNCWHLSTFQVIVVE